MMVYITESGRLLRCVKRSLERASYYMMIVWQMAVMHMVAKSTKEINTYQSKQWLLVRENTGTVMLTDSGNGTHKKTVIYRQQRRG